VPPARVQNTVYRVRIARQRRHHLPRAVTPFARPVDITMERSAAGGSGGRPRVHAVSRPLLASEYKGKRWVLSGMVGVKVAGYAAGVYMFLNVFSAPRRPL